MVRASTLGSRPGSNARTFAAQPQVAAAAHQNGQTCPARRVSPSQLFGRLNEHAARQKLAPGSMLLQPMRILSKTAIDLME